jgi:NAD+ synthase
VNSIDYTKAKSEIVSFIKHYVLENGFKNGLVGVSGGIDSALTLALTVEALGSENTFALLLPYKISSEDSLIDGKKVCEQLNVQYEVIDISPSVDAYFDRYPTDNPLQIGNKCARERMSVLYDYSVRKNALVVGTSNKSEILIGYATQYGDAAAAFLPIGDLYKTEVVELSKMMNILESIINKKPSADLWDGQTDEDEIGLSYNTLDEILYNLTDLKKTPAELGKIKFSTNNVKRVITLIKNSEYKRHMPPVALI